MTGAAIAIVLTLVLVAWLWREFRNAPEEHELWPDLFDEGEG